MGTTSDDAVSGIVKGAPSIGYFEIPRGRLFSVTRWNPGAVGAKEGEFLFYGNDLEQFMVGEWFDNPYRDPGSFDVFDLLK